jgi:BirA family transcriptional regulator, biotin operon repressor / biotin---[acetyl-CoA-carboxylase] ligase
MFTGVAGHGARYDADGGAAMPPGAWADEVRAALAGTRFGDIRWAAETGSTNTDALALARDGAGEGIVVVADFQVAGRGRRTRSWVAPPGGSLLVSVLLRPPAPVAGAVTMTVAVALAEAVEAVAGVTAGLKWPNDLVVDDRKLAGILAEADWPAGANVSAGWREPPAHARVPVVVGTGLNVAWPAVLPPELAEVAATATALDRLLSATPARPGGPAGTDAWPEGAADLASTDPAGTDRLRADVLTAYLRRLDVRYGELLAGGMPAILDTWRARSATLGRRVRVDLGADDVEGTAVDVTAEGHLVVETLAGDRRTLAVGDVVHLRRT